jgi:zinc transport system ATP-binding protein
MPKMSPSQPPSRPIVEVENISFSYGNDEVLSGITLQVPLGDYLGIIGPNGAGKTTLLKIILGLLTPSSGSIRLFGTDLQRFKGWSKIGYVPQKVSNFDANFPAIASEVVMMGRYARRGLFRKTTDEDRRAVKQALEYVDMWDYRDRLIGDLSGGQQQRIFIARALAAQPEIVFFDEPTLGVDEVARNEFYALLKRLNRESHLTLVLISHDIEMVTAQAQHIACIDRSLVCHGLPEEFLRDSISGDLLKGDIRIFSHRHHH